MEWGEGKATFFEQVNANVIQGEKVQGTPTTSSDTHTHTWLCSCAYLQCVTGGLSMSSFHFCIFRGQHSP